MFRHSSIACALALTLLSFAPLLAASQAGGAKILTGDEQAIHDYILTMEKVSKYFEVAPRLMVATKTDPALAAEVNKIGDADVPNLEKVLMAQQSPHIAAFLKNNGMTEREFVMTPLTLFSTQAAIQGQMNHKPIPDFVNRANLKFFQEHQGEILKYQKSSKAGSSSSS